MKKIFFSSVIFALLFIGTVYGQFTVTSYFNPHAGETQTLINGDTSGISPGGGGPNQTWNFSSVISTGDSSIQTYVLPSSTPYGSSFPTATIASTTPNNPTNYAYFSGTSSAYEFLGSQGTVFKTVYTNPKKFRTYPFDYPGSFSDSYSAITYQGTSIVQKISGTITVTYDGYGTLTLSSGTVTNAGRFKFVSYEVDTMIFGSVTTIEYIKDTSWRWAKSNYRYGLFEIEKSWISMDGINYSGFKWVGYIPNINSSIGIKIISSEIPSAYKLDQNFPNPFNPLTKIRYQIPKNSNVIMKIYDGVGREIETLCSSVHNAGIYELSWDASNYSSGIYFCRMIAEGFSDTKQLVLIK